LSWNAKYQLCAKREQVAIRLRAPRLAAPSSFRPAPWVWANVHADRSHGGGKPGELLLAARYSDGAQIPLRALVRRQGQDKTKVALGAWPSAHWRISSVARKSRFHRNDRNRKLAGHPLHLGFDQPALPPQLATG
jgi:hypothetical protein